MRQSKRPSVHHDPVLGQFSGSVPVTNKTNGLLTVPVNAEQKGKVGHAKGASMRGGQNV